MLPLAMLAGYFFSGFFARLGPMTPYMVFLMLFITFCRITPREMRLSKRHFWLLVVQLGGSIAAYLAIRPLFGEIVAQSLLVCILMPTATAAVAVAGLLGANIASIATFTLLSNIAVAVVAPVLFSLIGTFSHMPFIDSFLLILSKVMPLLLIPFGAAYLLMKVAPRAYAAIQKVQMLAFYIWVFALMIVTGQTVEFILERPSENYTTEIIIAALSFVVCLLQFYIGRAIGRRYGDKLAGGQSLGQKNTIFAIWMAQTYLDPMTSLGPASYVLWQNIVNSWQLWRARSRSTAGSAPHHSA